MTDVSLDAKITSLEGIIGDGLENSKLKHFK